MNTPLFCFQSTLQSIELVFLAHPSKYSQFANTQTCYRCTLYFIIHMLSENTEDSQEYVRPKGSNLKWPSWLTANN